MFRIGCPVDCTPSLVSRRWLRSVIWNSNKVFVAQGPGEPSALVDKMLIDGTGFFREREAFEALKAEVLPMLLANRTGGIPLRIWVPGCSTGEEAYSLAIVLREVLAERGAIDLPVKLFGTDISAAAIEKARAGRYTPRIEHDVSPERLEAFFTWSGDSYHVRKDLRELCIFATHDVTRDPPFSGMDLVSCRSLMSYPGHGQVLQHGVLPILHYALKERGILLLGTTETSRSFPGFSPHDEKHGIYARTAASPRLPIDVLAQNGAHPEPWVRPPRSARVGSPDVLCEADRALLDAIAPTSVVVTDDLSVVHLRGRTGPYLEPAPGVASLELMKLARNDLRLPLRQAIDEARTKGTRVRTGNLPLGGQTSARMVHVEVIPFTIAAT